VGEDSKFVPLNAEDPMYGPPVSRRRLRASTEHRVHIYSYS
jgi:hypothetical protein